MIAFCGYCVSRVDNTCTGTTFALPHVSDCLEYRVPHNRSTSSSSAIAVVCTRTQKLAGASLLVFANKQDLSGALGAPEIAQTLGLESKQFANRHWSIVGCSAVTGDGLANGLDWVVTDIGARIFMMS